MGSASLVANVNIAGMGFPVSFSESDEGAILQEVTVPKGYAGVTTSGVGTRAGVVTSTNSSPTITDSDFVDIYWDGGVLYGCNVSDVTAGAITFADGNAGGDVLPANGTVMVVSVRKDITVAFEGGDASALAASCTSGRCYIAFLESGSEHFAVDIANKQGWFWMESMGFANPIDGDTIDEIWVSTADITADQQFTVGVLYDSVS